MCELKTLGDLYWNCDSCYEDELQKEAIKWIEALQKVQGLELSEFTAHGCDSNTNTNVIRWIKHFFNITI